jgi:hypothetical protein
MNLLKGDDRYEVHGAGHATQIRLAKETYDEPRKTIHGR